MVTFICELTKWPPRYHVTGSGVMGSRPEILPALFSITSFTSSSHKWYFIYWNSIYSSSTRYITSTNSKNWPTPSWLDNSFGGACTNYHTRDGFEFPSRPTCFFFSRFSFRSSSAIINAMAVCIVFQLVAEATTTKHVASIEHTVYVHCRREGVDGFVVIENNADITLCSQCISHARDMINIQ